MTRRKLYFYKWRLVGNVFLTFLVFTVLSAILKPVFMLFNREAFKGSTFSDVCEVVWHGLPMDLSVAGYFTAVPALIALLSIWLHANVAKVMQRIYFVIATILICAIHLVDAVLYSYWGFRIDATPLFYFLSSPKDALASVSVWFVAIGAVVFLIAVFLLCLMFEKLLVRLPQSKGTARSRLISTAVMTIATALLIIPIRGSVTASTMNIGRVYYSSNQRLNHAAINPCFSLLASMLSETDVKNQYRFMQDAEADRLFAKLQDKSAQGGGSNVFKMLNTRRPNIVLVVLESFSAKIMETLGGTPGVAVNMDRLAKEGVLFTNFYANSFRTDRGLAAILAGFPAQPTMSIMKFPSKTEKLPMFTKELKQAGYNLKYYYGGDADFTNMRSFITTAGFEDIVCDADFPLNLRLSKWGVPDEHVFNKAAKDIKEQARMPYLKVIQTSSSHEPFDVPYNKLNNKILNAFAYTDDCLGKFVEQLKKLPSWKNTLLVLVPDHLGCYPENYDNYQPYRYHIPLILAGGALKAHGKIATFGSQVDIAATLLSQLGMPYSKFTFSKDMLNPDVPHFAFATVPNAFMMATNDNIVFFNCETNKVIFDTGKTPGKNIEYGKAYLQKLYDDIAKR